MKKPDVKKRKIGAREIKSPLSSKMLKPTRIAQILHLRALEQPKSLIAQITGASRATIDKHLENPGFTAEKTGPSSYLEPYKEQIKDCFFRCRGNCSAAMVMFGQELGHLGIVFTERTFRHYCSQWRVELKELKETARTFERYETDAGVQMQIDFFSIPMMIGTRLIIVHGFIAVMSFSRRIFVKLYDSEDGGTWRNGIECAFLFFGGVPATVLSDNSKCLVKTHRRGEAPEWNDKYKELAASWRFTPLGCATYAPQGKGKCERAVRYVKENALVGRGLESLELANEWVLTWTQEVADHRVLRHSGALPNTPAERFLIECGKLTPCKFHKPSPIEDTRHVDKTCIVQIDGKLYRAPEIARNKDVQILIDEQTIAMRLNGEVIAELDKKQSVYTPRWQDIEEARPKLEMDAEKLRNSQSIGDEAPQDPPNPIGRPMEEYESALGGNWNEPKASH